MLVVLVVVVIALLVVLVIPVVVFLVVLPLLVVLIRFARLAVIVWVVGTIVVLGVLVIYIVDVCVVVPTDRVVEVVSLLEPLPLSGGEHAFELPVAIVPSVGVDIAIAAYAVKVVEVDVQQAVALNAVQSKFNNHLVGDEASLCLDICESLCIC